MGAPAEKITDDGYDMVLRYRRKPGVNAPDLALAVSAVVTEDLIQSGLDDKVSVTLRVLQPVVGSEPSAWELRLTVPDLTGLGRVLDWAEKARSDGSILGRLVRIEGYDVVDEGVPLFRARRIK